MVASLVMKLLNDWIQGFDHVGKISTWSKYQITIHCMYWSNVQLIFPTGLSGQGDLSKDTAMARWNENTRKYP